MLLSLILILTAGQWRDYTLDRAGNQPQARKLALWPVRYAVLLAAVGLPGCFGSGHVSAVPAEPADRAGDGAEVLLSIYRTPFFFSMLPLAGWA